MLILDPETMETETISGSVRNGAEFVGWSTALKQVVVLEEVRPFKVLGIDPVRQKVERLADLDVFAASAALLDAGRRLAIYSPAEWDEDEQMPPSVSVLNLVTGVTEVAFVLEGLEHGLVPLLPEQASDPQWPFALLSPGIAWDAAFKSIYAVHADGGGVTVGDLTSGMVRTVRYEPAPDLWARASSWFIPAAQAKTSDNASRQAWLSADGGLLLTVAGQEQYRRDPENKQLTAIHRALGALSIDTATLQVTDHADLVASRGIMSPDATVWALAGDDSITVLCDQLCDSSHSNQPQIVSETFTRTGLYLVDPQTLEAEHQFSPGANVYPIGFVDGQLIVETFTEDGAPCTCHWMSALESPLAKFLSDHPSSFQQRWACSRCSCPPTTDPLASCTNGIGAAAYHR